MGYLAGHYDDTNSVAAFDKPPNRHDHGGNSANDHSNYKAFDFEYTANDRGYYHFLKPGPLGIVLRFTFYRELPTFQPNAKNSIDHGTNDSGYLDNHAGYDYRVKLRNSIL